MFRKTKLATLVGAAVLSGATMTVSIDQAEANALQDAFGRLSSAGYSAPPGMTGVYALFVGVPNETWRLGLPLHHPALPGGPPPLRSRGGSREVSRWRRTCGCCR